MGTLRILSHSGEPFADRSEAGRLLSHELKNLESKNTVILGIPRGGIIIAHEIALRLGASWDIILSRKIGAPFNPEFALGAISENGDLFLNEANTASMNAKDPYIQKEKKRQMTEIKRRGKLFREVRPKIALRGKNVVLTDDGVATGATFKTALWAARKEGPARLVAALPVGPEDTIRGLAREADEIICLRVPPAFDALSRFYLHFEQVDDDEVLAVLKSSS